jgi:hypothetical protein
MRVKECIVLCDACCILSLCAFVCNFSACGYPGDDSSSPCVLLLKPVCAAVVATPMQLFKERISVRLPCKQRIQAMHHAHDMILPEMC